jgi:undecaprenyl-diphosphatase
VSIELSVGAIALALFVLFAILGVRVSRGLLGRLDADAVWFRGQLMPFAILFTKSGRSPALTAACIIAIAIYAFLHLAIVIAVLVTLSQLLSQIVVELCKKLFRRIRPDYWLVGLEAGHSYPSGHATTAVVFFIGWAVVTAFGTLPIGAKAPLIGVLCLWALGIAWSRLALGAHYLSDVFGGALFGAAWLLAMFDIAARVFMIFSA